MDFEVPEEYRAMCNLAKRFLEEELRPLEKVLEDKGELLEETRERLKKRSQELGLWAPWDPIEEGGGGMPHTYLAQMMLTEVTGSTYLPLRAFVGRGGRRRGPMGEIGGGEERTFTAITEPNAGSDQRSIETTAVKDGDEWVINGVKHLISGVTGADGRVIAKRGIIYCKTDKEARRLTPFIVEVGTPGFTIGRQQKIMGMRGIYVNELYFDDCRVPDANRIGSVGTGLSTFLIAIGVARLGIGAAGVGAAQYCLDRSIDFAAQRITFRQPLITRQFIQAMLVDMAIRTETTRWLVYRTAWQLDQGEDPRFGYSACKILGSELACDAADMAIQIHGGVGYTADLPFERIYRDYRGSRIYEGANEIHKHIIARILCEQRVGTRLF